MCYEEVIPHVPGKYGRRDNIMCITMPIELKDRRFIMDSGSGHDLISSTRVDRVIELISTQRMASHPHLIWWTWTLTRSMSQPRHTC